MGTQLFVEKPEEKRSVGRYRHRWEDNIKMNFTEAGLVGIGFI
jgi:hypothetical protein